MTVRTGMEPLQVLTIVTEAALERVLVEDMLKLGARACSIVDARARGQSSAPIVRAPDMIQIEVIADEPVAPRLVDHLSGKYFEGYAMAIFKGEKTIVHSHKFF